MASPDIELRRGRTVFPTDIFVLIFLALGVAGASGASMNDTLSVAVFTLVWMTSAITRVAELRRGERPAVQISGLDRRQGVTLAVGCGAWWALGFMQSANASSIVWKPIDVPPVMWAIGVILAMAVIAEPFFYRLRGAAASQPPCIGHSAGRVLVRSGAILLLSGSPMFAVVCALWLGVTLWPATASVQQWRLRLAQHQSLPTASQFGDSAGYANRVDNAMPATLT